jgi:hypothetical protein
MSKSFERFSKDLAAGMSRRKAFQRFLGGLGAGAAAVLSGGRAFAGGPDMDVCIDFCRIFTGGGGRLFGQCVSESAQCPEGFCARPMRVNGGFAFGSAVNWVCVPVRPTPR